MGYIRWYVLLAVAVSLNTYTRDRVRIIFINDAPEDVYVTINTMFVTPGAKHCIPSGTRKYIFATEFSEQMPLHVTVVSMSYELQYMLTIRGNLARTSMRACRSYGDITLMRAHQAVDTISAINLGQGFILRYSPEYELSLTRISQRARPHAGIGRSTRMSPTKGCCP